MYCALDQAEILKRFVPHAGHAQVPVAPGYFVDYFGVRVPISCFPHIKHLDGQRTDQPPFPDDRMRAGFIEYLALVDSVDAAQASYAMAEVGASYAPFTAIAGRLALRKGLRQVVLCPVEAAANGRRSIQTNLEANALDDPRVTVHILEAAVVDVAKTVYFPDVDCTRDNGAAAQNNQSERDIRGANLPMRAVRGIPLTEVIDKFPADKPVDLMHVDIQGAEKNAFSTAMQVLNQRVKRVFVATHSREIEGVLMALFHSHGWELVAEEPCEFKYRRELDHLEGMTFKDGCQYWVNPRMAQTVGAAV
ncbi:MAG: FkbM family methyltransferase [Casimicrobiaceae bacterium]